MHHAGKSQAMSSTDTPGGIKLKTKYYEISTLYFTGNIYVHLGSQNYIPIKSSIYNVLIFRNKIETRPPHLNIFKRDT